jgi:serine/threonine protein kinase
MCILGAVFVEEVVIQPLTDYIWLGAFPLDTSQLLSVAHLFVALAAGLQTLDEFFRTIPLFPSKSPLSTRLFPHICSYSRTEGVRIQFRYVAKLAGNSPDKAIFKAQRQGDKQYVVVKFVERYNAEAHRILTERNLAPELLYVGKVSQPPSQFHSMVRTLLMVVMEFLSGSTAQDVFYKAPLPSPVFKDVWAAIKILHERDIVFGDLRRPNIMVLKASAKLVDFDWCGKDGEAKYPVNLNDLGDISWHPDVQRGSTMRKEHDLFMLRTLHNLGLAEIMEGVEHEIAPEI